MSQSILHEYDVVCRDYDGIYNNCKGKMDKGKKIKIHKLIEIEKNILENNRTEINTTERENLMGYVWAFIASMISMGTFYKDAFGEAISSSNTVLALCMIMMIFLGFVFYFLKTINDKAKDNAKTREDEYKKIRKMCLTQKVLEDLLLEEDQFSL